MTNKHTPAPWYVHRNGVICNFPEGIWMSCREADIAQCFEKRSGNKAAKKANMKANARLIVKAVNCHYELLEALERVLYNITHNREQDIYAIESAIKKAKGE